MFNIKNHEFTSLLNNSKIQNVNLKIFDNLILKFISEISKNIFQDKKLKNYPDIISFAFWIRENNLLKLKNDYSYSSSYLIGRGLVFHIVPSNVPTNFIYSLVFGLLSGNANIVKLPEKNFIQIELITKLIKKILIKKVYKDIKKSLMIIRYDKSKKYITETISKNCDARLVWGGDNTVLELKKIFTKINAIDINFPDKYSFSVIDTNNLNINYKDLAEKFYNDTFLYDQNACSSPHLILWFGRHKKIFKNFFWQALAVHVQKNYNSPIITNIEKLEKNILDNIYYESDIKTYTVNNILHIVRLKKIIDNVDSCRGKWGYFYEFDLTNLDQINKFCNDKFQTLTYFSKKNSKLSNHLKEFIFNGISRIVPIGKALELDLNWDGNDIIRILSKNICKKSL